MSSIWAIGVMGGSSILPSPPAPSPEPAGPGRPDPVASARAAFTESPSRAWTRSARDALSALAGRRIRPDGDELLARGKVPFRLSTRSHYDRQKPARGLSLPTHRGPKAPEARISQGNRPSQTGQVVPWFSLPAAIEARAQSASKA